MPHVSLINGRSATWLNSCDAGEDRHLLLGSSTPSLLLSANAFRSPSIPGHARLGIRGLSRTFSQHPEFWRNWHPNPSRLPTSLPRKMTARSGGRAWFAALAKCCLLVGLVLLVLLVRMMCQRVDKQVMLSQLCFSTCQRTPRHKACCCCVCNRRGGCARSRNVQPGFPSCVTGETSCASVQLPPLLQRCSQSAMLAVNPPPGVTQSFLLANDLVAHGAAAISPVMSTPTKYIQAESKPSTRKTLPYRQSASGRAAVATRASQSFNILI